MLVGAVAQLLTLGALLPFIAVLSDPARVASYPIVYDLFTMFGWSDASDIVIPVTMLFGVVTVVSGLILLYLAWMSQRFVFELGHDLSVGVFRRTLYQPYLYHVSKNSSDQIAAVNKVDAVVTGVLMQLMRLVTAAVISVFIIAALVVVDPVISVIAGVGFGVIYLVITQMTRRRVRRNSQVWSDMQTSRIRALQEGLGGIRDVILDHTQPTFINRYATYDERLRQTQANNQFVGQAPRYIIEICALVLIAVLAVAVSNRPGGLDAALPVLGVFALGTIRLLPMLQQLYSGWTVMTGYRHALVDVVDILDLPLAAEFQSDAKAVPLAFEREIRLHNVSFRYVDDRPLVLKEVFVSIPKGSRVGIIGKTGSGKSTIMDLVMGLMAPTSGEIRVDDTVLSGDAVRGWHAQIAHVPQAIYLADTTVAGNIAFGVADSEVDMNRVRQAARQAELAEFIESQPEQYDTIVGERGIRLSGGQRQRIGIARALYKQAGVLVFDEATSALDNETEAAVMESIEKLDRDLTLLIIAHRLTTVAGCDQVIKLEQGEVAGQGSYDEIVGSVSSLGARQRQAKVVSL
jgi:ABC-type multidrug transport system fused ATPase/permease subunit